MASIVQYTKAQFVERLKRHMNNNFPNSSYTVSDKEMVLYIDQALAFSAVGQVYAGAKVMGTIDVPEGYLTTYQLPTLTQNMVTNDWYATLPQPPVSLPLGYSISRCFFAQAGYGISQEILPIKAKRAGYRNNMPRPAGAEYRVNGDQIFITANDGSPLLGFTVFVEMLKTRTDSLTETMDLPDDVIEAIFNSVVQKLAQRIQNPQDIISDSLPAGNKSS